MTFVGAGAAWEAWEDAMVKHDEEHRPHGGNHGGARRRGYVFVRPASRRKHARVAGACVVERRRYPVTAEDACASASWRVVARLPERSG